MSIKGEYGESEHGNFKVEDTIGVPHPYCIGVRHDQHASDHFDGMLNDASISSAEREGIHCCECKGTLKYEEHKLALLVYCYAEFKDADRKVKPELQTYLLSIKEEAKKNGYAGFAFIRKRK